VLLLLVVSEVVVVVVVIVAGVEVVVAKCKLATTISASAVSLSNNLVKGS
jgi:hypothetical protein